jgi:hypothetical protein
MSEDDQPADVDPEYEELRTNLLDREWRLDNLYFIQNASGQVVKFVRNSAQLDYWRELWYRNVILKARQLGFSTFICILILDACLFNSNIETGLIDYTLDDAKKKLAKIKFGYEHLPTLLKEAVSLVKDNEDEIRFSNGSSIQVGTSHRGGTLQELHVSEMGRISAETPDKAKEIKAGAFGTVHAGQMVHVESTPKGTGGEFHDMVKRAQDAQKEKRQLSPLDFKLHFYPWHRNKDYRLQVPVPMTTQLDEYFEDLRLKHVINLDLYQRYWYAAMMATLGPDDMKSEYPSIPEECFFASLEGAYFKRELSRARSDGRIGQPVPHDPTRRVNTFWDIGLDDETAIWFHQSDGVRHRFIDYYECSGEGVQHFAKILRQKADELDYNFGVHYLPHDVEVREWGNNAKPRIDVMKELNIKPIDVGPQIEDKADAIEAARRMIGMSFFDQHRTARGVECLDNYRKEWDERRATWRAKPLHDWSSHGADAYMTGAVGLNPEAIPEADRRHRRPKEIKRSAWSA